MRVEYDPEPTLLLLEKNAGSLSRHRQPFLDHLRNAAVRDHSLRGRRADARQWAEQVKVLGTLEGWLDDAGSDFKDAVLVSLDVGGIYSGPDETVPIVKQVTRTVTRLSAELRKRREMAQRLAKSYRSGTVEKATQWGPSTLIVVNMIVREAQKALSATDWRRSVRARRRAEYYAGLLCMEVGLLPSGDPKSEIVIAERTRKRLQRGKRLLQAAQVLNIGVHGTVPV
jgi:hypothetical protein